MAAVSSLLPAYFLFSHRFLLHQYLSDSFYYWYSALLVALALYFAFLCYGNRSQTVYSRRISTAQYEKEAKEATEKALTCLWKSREFRDMKKQMEKEGIHSAWEEPEQPTEDEEP